MSDLKNKLQAYFSSEHKTYKEFETALNESAVQSQWVEAVTLFRAGMKKLKANDLSGMDDIKKANESLKAVVDSHKKEDVVKQADQLSEAVNSFNKETLTEDVELMNYQLGALYDKLKKDGMPSMLNEEEMYDVDSDVCDEEVKESCDSCGAPVTTEGAGVAPANATPVAPTPAAPEPTSVTPPQDASVAPIKEEEKSSAYEHGFNEARKRFKLGHNAKVLAKDIAEKELSEKSYSYVNRWMEGFNYGFAFQEEVSRDIDPKMFEGKDSK